MYLIYFGYVSDITSLQTLWRIKDYRKTIMDDIYISLLRVAFRKNLLNLSSLSVLFISFVSKFCSYTFFRFLTFLGGLCVIRNVSIP